MSIVVGIDVGSERTMVVRGDGAIVRNALGGHTVASLVGFGSGLGERQIGEAAVSQLSTNARNTVRVGERLSQNAALSAHRPGGASMEVEYDGGTIDVSTAAAAGALLRSVGQLAAASLGEGASSNAKPKAALAQVALAVPPCWTEGQRRTLVEGLVIADLVRKYAVVAADAAAQAVYARKHAGVIPEGQTKVVVFVDVGRCTATVSAGRFVGGRKDALDIVASESDQSDLAGTAALDAAVFDLCRATKLPKGVDAASVTPGSKKGLRLLGAVDRLRTLLSTMPEAKTTAENLGDERDVNLTLSRDEFTACCSRALDAFSELLTKVKAQLDAEALVVDAVEVFGGGTRVAALQQVIHEVFEGCGTFGAKLDDASVAHGAALIATALEDEETRLQEAEARLLAAVQAQATLVIAEDDAKAASLEEEQPQADDATVEEKRKRAEAVEAVAVATAAVKACQAAVAAVRKYVLLTPDNDDGDDVTAGDVALLRQAEDAMCAKDAAARRSAEKRNAFETLVLELRSARSGKHRACLDEDPLRPLLDDAEAWLWSEEAAAADCSLMESKLQELKAEARAKCPAYFEAVETERVETERELEAEAAKAAAERSADDEEDGDERREDRMHADQRRLKFADRLRLVEKNKAEGTELFKDGNIQHATKRFKDALGHATKFVDLSPDNESAARKLRVDLYLNLALCWSKLDNPDQVVKCCTEALAMDAANPKALYRRAAAYEKTKKFDDAKADLKIALEKAPDDKAILALDKRVDAQIAKQKKAEKKMWGKAFS